MVLSLLRGKTMNTGLQLQYYDESGYSQSIDVILRGEITSSQIKTIGMSLNEGDSIIAEQVGLPTPSEQFASEFEFPTDNDHVWTTINEFRDGEPVAENMLTDGEPNIDMSVDQFIESLQQVNWDIGGEMERLGITY